MNEDKLSPLFLRICQIIEYSHIRKFMTGNQLKKEIAMGLYLNYTHLGVDSWRKFLEALKGLGLVSTEVYDLTINKEKYETFVKTIAEKEFKIILNRLNQPKEDSFAFKKEGK
jgi:hypothetical protein